jgi:hypothetical protein
MRRGARVRDFFNRSDEVQRRPPRSDLTRLKTKFDDFLGPVR